MIDLSTESPANSYWHWYRALRLSNPENWVSSDTRALGRLIHLPYSEWWKANEEQFVPSAFELEQLNSMDEVNSWWQDYKTGDDKEDFRLLAIKVNQPYAILERQITDWLRETRERRTAGRPLFSPMAADYTFERPPQNGALHKMLTCLEIATDEKLGQYEIGCRAEVSPKHVSLGDRRSVQIRTWRYLKQARELVANVEQGRFPVYTSFGKERKKHRE